MELRRTQAYLCGIEGIGYFCLSRILRAASEWGTLKDAAQFHAAHSESWGFHD